MVTSSIPPDRIPLVVDIIRRGSLGKLLGEDPSLYPLESVECITTFPPLWVIHGCEDRLVPVEGTEKFVRVLREAVPSAQVHESYRPGPHGFDNEPSVSVEESWIQEGLGLMAPYWPQC